MLDTVLSAVGLRTNKAEGVPALLELTTLEGNADKQMKGTRKFQTVIMRQADVTEKDLGVRSLI